MLIIDIYSSKIFKNNNIIRLSQHDTLWKLTFSNRVSKVTQLTGDSYRSRWWLVLTFQTVDKCESYSLVIPRFFYPRAVYQKLSAHLWFYV